MEPTGSESCGLAKGVAILQVKSLKFDEKTLKIVIYSPKLRVADRRNRSALPKRVAQA